MKNITLRELKEIQLNVLEAVHNFCLNNNIKYSLACGTLLGAVRHKGYIPWDDDIDIYMLREEYNKFITLFPHCYKNHYELISLERNSNWNKVYAKAYDNRTIIYEAMPYKVTIGINIDIFPIDNVPEEEKEWINYNQKRLFFQQCLMAKALSFSSHRKFHKNLGIFLAKFLTIFINQRKLAVFLNYYSQKFNQKETKFVFENVLGIIMKRRFKKNIFKEFILMPFENKQFFAFKNYDEYLKNAYGNYMELPPINKRISHHLFKAYWK
ncbi:MAG: LicD family protein [Bacteroidaceae bacterium]|nr:LicD family protein [Bacteroidaceae bacterium]